MELTLTRPDDDRYKIYNCVTSSFSRNCSILKLKKKKKCLFNIVGICKQTDYLDFRLIEEEHLVWVQVL